MDSSQYFFDENQTRYHLVKTNAGTNDNWLFLPGGPGADSSYFLSLVHHLAIPGNIWLIDFPANGNNLSSSIHAEYNFDSWAECLMTAVKKFQNPICVGHSFGGMFPLLFPQLERLLKGMVILNASPSLWLEEAAKAALENQLPDLTPAMQAFAEQPSPNTFKEALLACSPYYFPSASLAKGTALLKELPVNYHASAWWLKEANRINFTAKWIPENIPTLILGSSHDFIVPFSIFEQDERFKRENIYLKKIQNAGHFPWIEQLEEVKAAFGLLMENLIANASLSPEVA